VAAVRENVGRVARGEAPVNVVNEPVPRRAPA